jgi:tRNA nucleotidyltransferase (CCA-adding enzyme)
MQIVTTHKNTDFDALASVMAVTCLHLETVPVIPRTQNPNVKAFLSIHKDLFEYKFPGEVDLREVTRLTVVDNNAWHRLEGMEPLRQKTDLPIHLWDHHADEGDIHACMRMQEQVGATITILCREIAERNLSISPIHATLFLAGIYEDTGNLTFPSTTPEDARAVAFLLEKNADLSLIGTFLRPVYGEVQKNVLFEMLKEVERIPINGFTVSIRSVTISGHVRSLALVVNMFRDIVNVDAAFGIFHIPDQDRCIIIGRADTDGLNIGSIMRALGGGGHPRAGSAMVKKVNSGVIESWITEIIQGGRQTSVQVSDLMSFPVATVHEKTSMGEVAEMLRERGCTGFPVVDEDQRLVGIISRRDFKKIKKQSQLSKPVKTFMSTDVKTIEPGKSPMQAARLMVKHDIGRLPVVGEGRILGIVTRSDTMVYFYDLLPD